MNVDNILTGILIISAALLIVIILLQHRSAGLGQAFGGGSGIYHVRRGSEKRLFQATIIFTVAFLTSALLKVIF